MITLSCLIIIAMTALLAQLSYSNSIANAASQIDRYWSGLTGDRQIPPVNTDARGYVGLKFEDDLGVFVSLGSQVRTTILFNTLGGGYSLLQRLSSKK